MPTILVSGAANGLGAAFVDAYRQQEGTEIIAIDRAAIPSSYENFRSFQVDVADEHSIDTFARQIQDEAIDLVIHSAGIRGLVPSVEAEKPNDVAACETISVMDMATLTRTFQINAAGTFFLLRALLPNLRRPTVPQPKVVVMSSRMGSIGNNELPNKDAGSAFAYRASKAALNTIVRSFAVDVPEVAFILCHPGRVETKLVKGVEAGAISVEESVASVMPLISTWDRIDSGKFYDRFGQVIQW
ncbi:hypothetical protein BDY17DRAFT_294640 [Neohortaea acidophila]|uniref:NAD(P)-binding protein n=1 Tax=Neohortaea acidophila TaxID=245834 RepID=A0A6A6PW71_9PEZI|nr:uncharacterized protein BDY17DRAFT_294640 [Neohortaea acidophila]KAF2483919.1 hypothetical protein BDY17DRAFT_294640 [Neohortaea acidophila]